MPSFNIETDKGVYTIDSESSEEELNAYFGTEEGQADLQTMIANAGPEPSSPGTNVQGLIEGIWNNPNMPASERMPAVSDWFAGMARSADEYQGGVRQMYYEALGDRNQVAGIQKLEEISRKKYAEIDDQGVGAEDFGEAFFSLATLLLPGKKEKLLIDVVKNPQAMVNGAVNAAKGLQRIKDIVAKGGTFAEALGRTAGGNAILAGAGEMVKATVEGESRVEKGATAAATGFLVYGALNKLGGNSVFEDGFIGKTGTVLGLGKLLGASPSATRAGIMRSINRTLFSKKGVDPKIEADPSNAASLNSPQRRDIVVAGFKKELATIGSPEGQAAASWNAFHDLMKGTADASGKRSGGMVKIGNNKYARANNIDTKAETSKLMASLFDASKIKLDAQNVGFSKSAFIDSWRHLRSQPEFQKIYGGFKKNGEWSPHKTVRNVDEWIEQTLSEGPDTRTIKELTAAADRDLMSLYNQRAAAANRAVSPEEMDIIQEGSRRFDRLAAIAGAEYSAQSGSEGTPQESAGVLFDGMGRVWEYITEADQKASISK